MSDVIQALRNADPEKCSLCFLMPYCREQNGCMAHEVANTIEVLQTENELLRKKLDEAVGSINHMRSCSYCKRKDCCPFNKFGIKLANGKYTKKCFEWCGAEG